MYPFLDSSFCVFRTEKPQSVVARLVTESIIHMILYSVTPPLVSNTPAISCVEQEALNQSRDVGAYFPRPL